MRESFAARKECLRARIEPPTMRHRILACSIFAAVLGASLAFDRSASAQSPAPAAAYSAADVARGTYLVRNVGMCADCHGEKLTGGPNQMGHPPPGVPWALSIPSLVGLALFSNDADAITFLETGLTPGGQHALPPMPQYRFNTDDAHAIVAYLRTYKP